MGLEGGIGNNPGEGDTKGDMVTRWLNNSDYGLIGYGNLEQLE